MSLRYHHIARIVDERLSAGDGLALRRIARESAEKTACADRRVVRRTGSPARKRGSPVAGPGRPAPGAALTGRSDGARNGVRRAGEAIPEPPEAEPTESVEFAKISLVLTPSLTDRLEMLGRRWANSLCSRRVPLHFITLFEGPAIPIWPPPDDKVAKEPTLRVNVRPTGSSELPRRPDRTRSPTASPRQVARRRELVSAARE